MTTQASVPERSEGTGSAAETLSPAGRQSLAAAEGICHDHGAALLALAGMLLDERAAAEVVVTRVIVDAATWSETDGSTSPMRHRLARRVFWRCTDQHGDEPSRNLPDRSAASRPDLGVAPAAVAGLRELSAQQRAALALVLFGGHTYQEVAGLLGLPAPTVAGLLVSGLQELQR